MRFSGCVWKTNYLQRERSFRTYGYRRMWLWLKSQNIFFNPKTVFAL